MHCPHVEELPHVVDEPSEQRLFNSAFGFHQELLEAGVRHCIGNKLTGVAKDVGHHQLTHELWQCACVEHFLYALQGQVHSALQGIKRFHQIRLEVFACSDGSVGHSYFFIKCGVQHLVQHSDVVHALVGASSCATNKNKALSIGHSAQEHATRFIPVGFYASFSNLRG